MKEGELQRNPSRLIVLVAFDHDDNELVPVFGPAEQQGEDRAIRAARALADRHAGVIAWSREADIDLGEYGPPTVLFQAGDVPEME